MLSIKDLTLGYEEKQVLHLSNFELPQGGQCLITGASGSGKTTLLYAIAGLINAMQGTITIDSTEITALSEAGRDSFRGRYIGIIFQTLHLMRSLSVIDNLLLASYSAGLPQNENHARIMLHRLGIHDKIDAAPDTLSQGQAQRVAIARAVLHRPALILADEPTSSLDDANCEKVINLIRQIAKETGAALLISTHDHRVKSHFSHILQVGEAR
jgi:putative ABC transport system ATP-binding protein